MTSGCFYCITRKHPMQDRNSTDQDSRSAHKLAALVPLLPVVLLLPLVTGLVIGLGSRCGYCMRF